MRYTWKTGRRVLVAFLAMTLGAAGCDSFTAPEATLVDQVDVDERFGEDAWADEALGRRVQLDRPLDKYPQ